MIRVIFLFLSTGISLVVAVALIVGIAWLAVAVPVLIATGAGYGVVMLRRHGARRSVAIRPGDRSAAKPSL